MCLARFGSTTFRNYNYYGINGMWTVVRSFRIEHIDLWCPLNSIKCYSFPDPVEIPDKYTR